MRTDYFFICMKTLVILGGYKRSNSPKYAETSRHFFIKARKSKSYKDMWIPAKLDFNV